MPEAIDDDTILRILQAGTHELIVNNPETTRVLFIVDDSVLPGSDADPINQLLDELGVIIRETSPHDTRAVIEEIERRHLETPDKRLILICCGVPDDFYDQLEHIESMSHLDDFARMRTVLQWFSARSR